MLLVTLVAVMVVALAVGVCGHPRYGLVTLSPAGLLLLLILGIWLSARPTGTTSQDENGEQSWFSARRAIQ